MKNKLIIANWKMNPLTVIQAVQVAQEIGRAAKHSKAEIVIVPPFPFLIPVGDVLKKVKLGAQNVFWEEGGAHTGEISITQLKSVGVKYVIVGHSERRALGETDDIINKKVRATLKAGLKVILCVGENKAQRAKGITYAKKFVAEQIKKDFKNLPSSVISYKSLVIAYEPVWAISTTKNRKDETPADAATMIRFIKKLLAPTRVGQSSDPFRRRNRLSSVKALYGGSVNAKNAHSFLLEDDIDGLLVGAASLHPKEFKKIIS